MEFDNDLERVAAAAATDIDTRRKMFEFFIKCEDAVSYCRDDSIFLEPALTKMNDIATGAETVFDEGMKNFLINYLINYSRAFNANSKKKEREYYSALGHMASGEVACAINALLCSVWDASMRESKNKFDVADGVMNEMREHFKIIFNDIFKD